MEHSALRTGNYYLGVCYTSNGQISRGGWQDCFRKAWDEANSFQQHSDEFCDVHMATNQFEMNKIIDCLDNR